MPKRQLTKAELLEVAATVVTRYGFAKTSMADIATTAGVSKGLLYLRFPDKDALLMSLLDREFVLALRATLTRVDADERGGLLSRIYLHTLHGLRSRPLLWSFYVTRDPQLNRFAQRGDPGRYERRIEAGRTFMRRLYDDGIIQSDLGGQVTGVLWLFTFGLAASAPHQGADQLIEGVAELVQRGLDADVADTEPGKRAFRRFVTDLTATTEWSDE